MFVIRPVLLALSVSLLFSCGLRKKVVTRAENPLFFQFHDVSNAPQQIHDASNGVVRINQSGTGFFISDDGLLVTNHHILGYHNCMREGCSVRIDWSLQRGKTHKTDRDVMVEPLFTSTRHDVTVLQVWQNAAKTKKWKSPEFVELSFLPAKKSVGTEIYVVGHPAGGLKKWSHGKILAMELKGAIYSDAFTIGGNSGSPILNGDGRAIGILHSGLGGNGEQVTRVGFADASLGTNFSILTGSANMDLADFRRWLTTKKGSNGFLGRSDNVEDANLLRHYDAIVAGRYYQGDDLRHEDARSEFYERAAGICDTEMAKDGIRFDDSEELSQCYDMLGAVDCVSGLTLDYCPENRGPWLQRFESMSKILGEKYASASLRMKIAGHENLSSSFNIAALTQNLDPIQFPMTPKLLYTFTEYFEVDEIYEGKSLKDYLDQFASDDRIIAGNAAALAGSMLNLSEEFTAAELDARLLRLQNSAQVSIGDYLEIEEARYLLGYIK